MSLQQPPQRILLASDFSADYHIEIGPRWIELVACTLLGDTPDDRQLLDAYIDLHLQERMARAIHREPPH